MKVEENENLNNLSLYTKRIKKTYIKKQHLKSIKYKLVIIKQFQWFDQQDILLKNNIYY